MKAATKLMNKDELYIKRTFDLARLGLGAVSPNPLVGCVIVYQDKIIGEGWHKAYGEAHAEVNAINSVADKHLLPESTVYVSLEPCAHFGKTPPCADLLISYGVKRVVISNVDKNPLVGGKGIQKLKEAGILVTTDVLQEHGAIINKRFFTALQEKRPYIILKWAETSDGFIAKKNYESKWISSKTSRKLVHKWRAEEDAIMVGTNTAHYDNPMLNVREWSGRSPVRVVIDRNLRLSTDLNLFDGKQQTICYNLLMEKDTDKISFVKISEKNFLKSVLTNLYDQNIRSVIVEGGTTLLNLLIEAGLWDEARVFSAPQKFKEGIAAPKISGPFDEKYVEEDRLLVYKKV